MAAILDLRSERFLLIFIYKLPRYFILRLGSFGFSVQEKNRKMDFQDGHLGHGGHLGFAIGAISTIFNLQVITILPTKFRVNWPFGSGKEVQNRFLRWLRGGRLGFSIGTIWLILTYKLPRYICLSFESTGLSVREKKRKIYFQDDSHAGHHRFSIGSIFSYFNLKVTSMLPTKFQVNWPRDVGEVGF